MLILSVKNSTYTTVHYSAVDYIPIYVDGKGFDGGGIVV